MACLGALLEAHRPRLQAIALGMLGTRDRAEDAVHETFVVALRRIGDVRDPAAAGAWLAAVMRNVCRQELRRGRAVVAVGERVGGAARGVLGERLERAEERAWVRGALAALSEPLRITLLLRHFGAGPCSYESIAAACGVPVGTVRSRLHAARRMLADRLADEAAPITAARDAESHARLRAWGEAWARFGRAGDVGPLADVMAPDVAFALLDRVPRRGVAQLGSLLLADLSDGVRPVFRGALPGDEVSLVELELVNPADDPDHCPPLLTQVLVHPRGTVERLVFRYEGPPS
jgi:RNA polymerase sigma-70 factor (ECF subfamily)